MGFRFRKTIKAGPVNVNLSKSGVGYSVGAGGVRYTHSPKRKKKGSEKAAGKSGIWQFLVGCFFLIGGLSYLGNSFSSFLLGVALSCAFFWWGRKVRKQ